MNIAKKKSIVGFNSLCVWMSSVFNKVTGYDQITELESRVTVSERVFENTTQSLRELNTEYLVIGFVLDSFSLESRTTCYGITNGANRADVKTQANSRRE